MVDSIIASPVAMGRFTDFGDFLRKIDGAACNKRCGGVSLVKAGAFDSLGHTRRGLHRFTPEAVDAIVETKRADQSVSTTYSVVQKQPEPEFSLRIGWTIPVGEWDKTTLLANEREMLGLYVSDHPLNGSKARCGRATDCSIAAMYTDEVTDGRVVTVGGLVTGVARKVTKRGDTWAIVSLEDLDASVEAMVFPKAYH